MNTYLWNRDVGRIPSREFRYAQTDRLYRSLHRSSNKSLRQRHDGAVNTLDIEQINGR